MLFFFVFRIAFLCQVALQGALIYDVGFVGINVFFVLSGEVRVTLATNPDDVDSHGLDALLMLKRKEESMGEVHGPGTHFGEYCLISKCGFRPDRAVAHTRAEVYGLSYADIETLFKFTGLAERKTFIFELMTKVRDLTHTEVPLSLEDTVDENIDASHTRLLHRFSHRILKEILSELSLDNSVRDRKWSVWLASAKIARSSRELNSLNEDPLNPNRLTSREEFAAYLHDHHRVGNRASFTAVGLARKINRVNENDDEDNEGEALQIRSKAGSMDAADDKPDDTISQQQLSAPTVAFAEIEEKAYDKGGVDDDHVLAFEAIYDDDDESTKVINSGDGDTGSMGAAVVSLADAERASQGRLGTDAKSAIYEDDIVKLSQRVAADEDEAARKIQAVARARFDRRSNATIDSSQAQEPQEIEGAQGTPGAKDSDIG